MHYRNLALTTILFVFLAGNAALSQSLSELDAAYNKDFKKLKQYPQSAKRISALQESYEAISQGEQQMISSLRATGQPDIWYDIYRLYNKMDLRQKELQTLPGSTLKVLAVPFQDYSESILESKNRAETYFYAHAKKLLGDGGQEAAGLAYDDLVLLAGLSRSHDDLDVLLRKAVLDGATKLEYEFYNRTGKTLNEKIVDQISVAVMAYRAARKDADATTENLRQRPFIIKIYLTDLKVSPDRVKKANYVEERDVYSGDVVVDTIRCSIDEYKQVKGAVLDGRIDIYDVNMKNVINTVPIHAESMFVYSYATLKGNPDAAGKDTRVLLARKEVEFPSNEAIVMDAAAEFTKEAVKVLLNPKQ